MKEDQSFIRIIELSGAGATVREPSGDEIIALAKKMIMLRLGREDTIKRAVYG